MQTVTTKSSHHNLILKLEHLCCRSNAWFVFGHVSIQSTGSPRELTENQNIQVIDNTVTCDSRALYKKAKFVSRIIARVGRGPGGEKS